MITADPEARWVAHRTVTVHTYSQLDLARRIGQSWGSLLVDSSRWERCGPKDGQRGVVEVEQSLRRGAELPGVGRGGDLPDIESRQNQKRMYQEILGECGKMNLAFGFTTRSVVGEGRWSDQELRELLIRLFIQSTSSWTSWGNLPGRSCLLKKFKKAGGPVMQTTRMRTGSWIDIYDMHRYTIIGGNSADATSEEFLYASLTSSKRHCPLATLPNCTYQLSGQFATGPLTYMHPKFTFSL